MFEWWWAYLALGAYVGFFSGLLGIGGGSATVPVLAFIFGAKHFPPDHVVHLALGTGIASILFTSIASVRSHHLRSAVNWTVLRGMAPGLLIGTFGGALLARVLDARLLSVAFTCLIYYFAAQMLRTRNVGPGTRAMPGKPILSATGAGIGFISSLSATGGASLVVPFLVKRRISIHEAIGTAAAVGAPIALAGTAGYVISGMAAAGRPALSVGFVYLPALAGIVIASVAMAPLGASMAHRMSGPLLKKIFAIVLFVLATSMLVKFL